MQTFAKPFPPLSDRARHSSLQATLAARPADALELWLFAYGSLMWDPRFQYAEARPARLMGWQRSFCVWTTLARGTLAAPGLGLALIPGGECHGLAFRIAAGDQDAVLPQIWQREMWTDVYQPAWLRLDIAAAAIAFTANRGSGQCAGRLSFDDTVAHIAQASGERGRCRDYLANTVAELARLEIADPSLDALLAAVDAGLNNFGVKA